jgi:tetratricopeptide (TPR) repeat protein
MGLLQQLRLEEGRPQIALAFYRMALSLDEFDTMGEAADCHYKIGEILHWLNGEPNLIIAAYKNALALNPGHVWAHMNLGVALYARDRDIARAEAELFVARDLQPTNHVVYYHLGEIYLQEGHVADARFYYLQSLTLEPEFEPAQRRLTQLEHR